MATSDTGSSFAQWSDLFHHDPTPDQYLGAAADSTVVTSTAAPASPTSAGSGGRSGSGSGSPSRKLSATEGLRAGKPATRKRSRASRRAPVTMLNTDAANFRAMVQQFTGIPAPSPFAAGSEGGAPVINFAGDYGFPPPASLDQLLHQRQPQAQQLLRPQPQQQYTGGAGFGYGLAGGGHGDVFSRGGLDSAEERMFMQSLQAAQMPASIANSSSNLFYA